jgi:hypothetical protein
MKLRSPFRRTLSNPLRARPIRCRNCAPEAQRFTALTDGDGDAHVSGLYLVAVLAGAPMSDIQESPFSAPHHPYM